MRISYNSPVILTYTLIAFSVLLIDQYTPGSLTQHYFTLWNQFDFRSPVDYFRAVSHVIGHADWPHFLGNFMLILLIGPILEEKYGSWTLFEMIVTTALATTILNLLFFNTGLLGASGIVFMLILLASFANVRTGRIPLTFILILLIYIGSELLNAFRNDSISQFAHITGGIAGSLFGFLYPKKSSPDQPDGIIPPS